MPSILSDRNEAELWPLSEFFLSGGIDYNNLQFLYFFLVFEANINTDKKFTRSEAWKYCFECEIELIVRAVNSSQIK